MVPVASCRYRFGAELHDDVAGDSNGATGFRTVIPSSKCLKQTRPGEDGDRKDQALRLQAGGPKLEGRVRFSDLAELPKASSDRLATIYQFKRSVRLLGISFSAARHETAANAKPLQQDLAFY